MTGHRIALFSNSTNECVLENEEKTKWLSFSQKLNDNVLLCPLDSREAICTWQNEIKRPRMLSLAELYIFCPIREFVCVLSHFSRVQLFANLWPVAHQAPLSMGFSRQEYWSGLPCLPPGDLPDPGSPTSPALAGGFFTTTATWNRGPKETDLRETAVSSPEERP